MPEAFADRLETHEDMLRRLIQIAAHQDVINEDLRAMMGRMDARMTEMEERQERHEARLDEIEERQGRHEARMDATIARLYTTLDRLDTTLARWLERGTNGRDATR